MLDESARIENNNVMVYYLCYLCNYVTKDYATLDNAILCLRSAHLSRK